MTQRFIGSRLFLSCDLVGSTRRKQDGGDTAAWIKVFLEFYRLFPALFRDKLAGQRDAQALTPRLWKPVGDELLFVCDVAHEKHVHALVSAWLEAMESYEQELTDERLSTKGSAFIATFPFPDREVRIARDLNQSQSTVPDAEADNERALLTDASGHVHDFLGPSIDTGFRIASRATHRYFAMSIEVTWAYSAVHERAKTNPTALRLLEEIKLKGVWNDRAYPVFALDRENTLPVNEKLAKVRGEQAPGVSEVCALCRACAGAPNWPSAIHLPESDRDEFKTLQYQLDHRGAELDNLHDQLQSWPVAGEAVDGDGLPSDLPDD